MFKEIIKSHYWFILFILISTFILYFLSFRGLVYYDEGYVLNSVARVASGQIPYKDFDMVYTPLSFLTTALMFKIFGISVLVGRVLVIIISLISILLVYVILKLITKSSIVIFLSLFFFLSWGTIHQNFPSPPTFALFFTLLTLYFLIQGSKTSLSKQTRLFFGLWRYSFFKINLMLAGFFSILVCFSKQNFGIAIICVSLISIIFLKHRKEKIFWYILGSLFCLSVFFLYFLATNSLPQFIQNMNIYTFQRVVINQNLSTPFLYSGSFINTVLKLIFYALPLIFSIISFFHLWKTNNKHFLALPLFVTFFYIAGIRPETDYNHYVLLLAFSAVLFPFLISGKNFKKNILWIFCFLVLIAVGFYTSYFKGYYKWEAPLEVSTYFDSNPRVQVYLPDYVKSYTDNLVSYIDAHSKQTDEIFVNAYDPMIYFVSNRQNATRYDIISPDTLPFIDQKNIIKTLQDKKIKIVVLFNPNIKDKSQITQYILKNYKLGQKTGDYEVMLRKQ